MPYVVKHVQRLLPLAGLLAASFAMPAQAQSSQGGGAAAAISEAVQEGSNPYRPPAAATTDPEAAKRARCEALMQEANAAKKRSYSSPGTATLDAQGRPVPKLERDTPRKDIRQAYEANCT